jgi:hypothetical protein
MAYLSKPIVIRYLLPDGKAVPKETPGARRVRERATDWYGNYKDVDDRWACVALCPDKGAARTMLRELSRKAQREAAGCEEASSRAPPVMPKLRFQKSKPQLQFSLWDLCCVMALTGLGVGLVRWYRDGFSGVFAIVIWSIVAGGLVFTLRGREIRTLVVIAVLSGLAVLAGAWLLGLGEAMDADADDLTYYGDTSWPLG